MAVSGSIPMEVSGSSIAVSGSIPMEVFLRAHYPAGPCGTTRYRGYNGNYFFAVQPTQGDWNQFLKATLWFILNLQPTVKV